MAYSSAMSASKSAWRSGACAWSSTPRTRSTVDLSPAWSSSPRSCSAIASSNRARIRSYSVSTGRTLASRPQAVSVDGSRLRRSRAHDDAAPTSIQHAGPTTSNQAKAARNQASRWVFHPTHPHRTSTPTYTTTKPRGIAGTTHRRLGQPTGSGESTGSFDLFGPTLLDDVPRGTSAPGCACGTNRESGTHAREVGGSSGCVDTGGEHGDHRRSDHGPPGRSRDDGVRERGPVADVPDERARQRHHHGRLRRSTSAATSRPSGRRAPRPGPPRFRASGWRRSRP